jgi:hypothetical protein
MRQTRLGTDSNLSDSSGNGGPGLNAVNAKCCFTIFLQIANARIALAGI